MIWPNMNLIREERKLKEEEKKKRDDKTDDTVPVLGQVKLNKVKDSVVTYPTKRRANKWQ